MAKESGDGALGRGEDRTWSMALWRYFFPMYPLGQSVSEMSSMGMTNGCFGGDGDDDDDDDDGDDEKCRDEDNEVIIVDLDVMTVLRVNEVNM